MIIYDDGVVKILPAVNHRYNKPAFIDGISTNESHYTISSRALYQPRC